MQSISVFLNVRRVVDFSGKNADVSRTHGLCHVINIFLGSFLGKVQLCKVSLLQDMCDRFQEGGDFLHPSSVSSPEKNHSEQS